MEAECTAGHGDVECGNFGAVGARREDVEVERMGEVVREEGGGEVRAEGEAVEGTFAGGGTVADAFAAKGDAAMEASVVRKPREG